MNVLEKLTSIFREVFYDDDIVIELDMTANDIDGWDSLSNVNLILAIESGFNIKFSHKELTSFKNIGEILGCITSKIII